MRLGEELRARLPAGGLGEHLYAFEAIDSTNTFAARLAGAGAKHGTLVVAEAQSRGRGRSGASWHSPAGSSLSLSVVLRLGAPSGLRLAGLGALAVAEALEGSGLAPRIKWPNDVLLDGRKVSGVLVEGVYQGDQPDYVIVGIGVNVGAGSVPPATAVDFPATSVESAGGSLSLGELAAAVVRSLENWCGRIASPAFLSAWQSRLAYLGRPVRVEAAGEVVEGVLLGLAHDGSARLRTAAGKQRRCGAEAGRMRAVDSRRD